MNLAPYINKAKGKLLSQNEAQPVGNIMFKCVVGVAPPGMGTPEAGGPRGWGPPGLGTPRAGAFTILSSLFSISCQYFMI